MTSWQMSAVAAFVRLTRRRNYETEQAGLRNLARPKGPSQPPAAIRRRFAVSTTRDHGFDVHRVRPHGDDTGMTVIYLHGGAYTSEIVRQHWSLIDHIADGTGHEVAVPIYGLAPAHHGLQALELVTAVIAAETARGRRCYLAGDSAGGGLALLAAQAVAGTAGGVAGVTAIAPWLDLSISNPEVDRVEPHDPWLRRPGLRPLADAWAGGIQLQDPRLSPLFGDLTRLPPLQILVGTRDITLPDCRLLRDRLPSSVPLTYHEERGAVHVYPLLPVPEARAGRHAIIAHIRASTAR
ncbi:alpha/beta hydrolase fold domain-containing protein [Actinoplanes sp. CA-252034]|uniref:alpha/beta hydrolase fold domain-containing protein n=1 Tax=Actinoplanes sp. CA-252034 TaxID=3239906 RepID=UPI003D988B0B